MKLLLNPPPAPWRPLKRPSQQSHVQLSLSTALPSPASTDVTYMPKHSTATGTRGASSTPSPHSICHASCCAPAASAALANGPALSAWSAAAGLPWLSTSSSNEWIGRRSFWLPDPRRNAGNVFLMTVHACC
jgi:hypothetical protein